MTYSTKWLHLRESESKFFSCRYNIMQNRKEMVKDLEIALTKAEDVETALRLLRDMQPDVEIIMLLLSKIIDNAIDSSNLNIIELARNVLDNYKYESIIKSNIQILIASYLAKNDEWNYRRIAEFYQLMNYKEELIGFIELCQINANVEIQEIGDDFYLSGN